MLDITPHYLVITGGTTGDIHPFMRIASALQELGRKVTFISNTYHARLVEGAGFAFLGLGTDEDYLRVVANPDLWDPKKGFSVLFAGYSDLLEQIDKAIRSLCTHAPLVVIAHPLAVPGAVIARERGFVHSVVAAYLAPSNLRSCFDPLTIGPTRVRSWVPMRWRRALWRFVEKGWIDPVTLAHLNAVRTPLGLPKIESFLTHLAQAPDLSVTLFPSWFASTAPDWPQPLISGDFQLFESAPQQGLTPELCAFLAAGDKPVVFTAGTGNLHAADFFACALDAVDRLGCRAVFLSRDRAQVPAHLPVSVLWQPYVPLCLLLPHAAAFVHHGGIGTCAEALRAGTPQLIAPFAWDQFDNGARIASLGAGMVIPAKRLRPGKLAKSLQALCSSHAIHADCSRLATRLMPAPDPTGLCREVDRFVQARLGAA